MRLQYCVSIALSAQKKEPACIMHIVHAVKTVINLSTVYLQPISTAVKKNLLSGMLLLTMAFLQAQPVLLKSSTSYSLKAGPAITILNSLDKNFSSLPYTGTMAGLDLCFGAQTKKAFHELAVFFTAGSTHPGSSTQTEARSIYSGLGYSQLYTVAKNNNDRLQWLAGGRLSYLYAHRNYSGFINNASSFETALSLGVVLKADYTFKQLHGFSISDKLIVPFTALLLQPSYGSQDIEGARNGNGTNLKSLLGASRLVSFGSYSGMTNCLVLCKKITGHHAVSAEYCIDYYRVATSRPVKNAMQRFVLNYQLMF